MKGISQNDTAYINFNLKNSTLKHDPIQQIAIYGCNTSLIFNKKGITGSKNAKGPDGFTWQKNNQIVSGVPFGHQSETKTNGAYYISKYYISSPPVFNKNKKQQHVTSNNLEISTTNTLFDIGLITPDTFIFNGEKPVQMVYLDYSILKPTYIQYINIEFDDSFTKEVDKSLINLIPFKVQCNDFPWIDTKKIKKAKGASGIGAFDRSITKKGAQPNRLFLPYYYNDTHKKYLDCEITILNDIILNYELFFIVDGKKHKTINLKKYYLNHGIKTVEIHAKKRKKIPCGCIPPKK